MHHPIFNVQNKADKISWFCGYIYICSFIKRLSYSFPTRINEVS